MSNSPGTSVLPAPSTISASFGTLDGRRWTDHRDAFTLNDNRLLFPNSGLLGIKQAHMLHGDWMIWMPCQFMGQAGVAFVPSCAVESIELIVRILPAFSEECEPLARKPEKMLIIIEPYGLRFEGESGDRKLGQVQLLPVALDGHSCHSFQSGLARGEQFDASILRF